MAIIGFNESSLLTSEVFNGISEMSGSDPKQKAIKLIKTAKHLSNEDIEGAYIQVKQYSNSLSRAAMKAFDDEKTVLIYNNVQSLSVTQALPFITFNTPRGYVTYVFMDKYIQPTRDGILNLQAPVLHDLLVAALIANRLKSNYDILASNQYLQGILMQCYTKFVCRVLNREFSIAAEKVVNETVQYWVNKFFLLRVFGAIDTPENIEIISARNFKYIDEMKMDEIKRRYNEADPMKISELLDLIKTASPRMKTLSLGVFLSNWINYYYIPSMLAVDNIEYLIFMILSLLSGNNIISIAASEMVKETKNIKTLKEELMKLIQ